MDIDKELAQKFLDMVNGTQSFVIDQAPDVLQQIIAWELWSSVTYLITAVVVALSGWAFFCKLHKWMQVEGEGRFDNWWGLYTMTVVAPVVAIPMFFTNLQSLIKVIAAPKVYLIEFLSRLIVGTS